MPPGTSGVGNCYERIPGEGRSEICTVSDSVSQGGGVCNLVAQGYLHAVPNADFAIHNAGSCETDLATGDFTVEEAYDLLPYSNTLVTFQVNLTHHTPSNCPRTFYSNLSRSALHPMMAP